MTDSELHIEKLNVAAEFGYKGSALASFATRLRGETPEEIREDAAALVKLLGPSMAVAR